MSQVQTVKSTEAAAAPRASDAFAMKLTSSELATTMSHYHRAEIARMAGWRDRIDRTTNWAITVVAAMLSVSLSTPTRIMACCSSPWCWCYCCW